MGKTLGMSDVIKEHDKVKGGFERRGNVAISTHNLIPPNTKLTKEERQKAIAKVSPANQKQEQKEKKFERNANDSAESKTGRWSNKNKQDTAEKTE